MKEFKKKRDNLELFIKEQIIGPGAFNKRYFFLNDWRSSDFEYFGKTLSNETSFSNLTEVIPEVPAYQYSSAILFPETRIKTVKVEEKDNDISLDNEITDSEESENTSADDEDFIANTTENLVSKQQNYPNQLGISFVVNENTIIDRDLKTTLNFRKYYHVSKKECLRKKIAIWVPEYTAEIERAIQTYFSSLFCVEKKDGNYFVFIHKEIDAQIIYEIDYIYLNKYLGELITEIQNVFVDGLKELDNKNGITYYGLSEGNKVQFYSQGLKRYKNTEFNNVITLFDNSLLNFITKSLKETICNYSKYKTLIKKIEVYNQLKNIVTDLKSIFKDRNATPIWQSKFYNLEFKLPEYDREKLIDRKELISVNMEDPELKDLKIKAQYIRKGKLIYVKVQLINYFQINLEPNEPSQLNKKDEANRKSFFGVQLVVKEIKADTLVQYNPPQLLDIDEEDSFNKLLYRNYIDYGEGYNTSVTWGIEGGLIKISTEFLPEQESPNVNFTPIKIENGELMQRLKEVRVLSMRYLSTLSSASDQEVQASLYSFIGEYKNWIEEKREELDMIENEEHKNILTRQVNACELDYKRLYRNISLLEKGSKGMIAFRVMNTAMFMQMHHNMGIRLAKKNNKLDYFKEFENNEDYYKEAKCIEYDDYKWRSFQLAFIILNIDGFVKPRNDDHTVDDVFKTGWPERNEIADLVWFPTGGGKTEAYLGIIAFTIAYRRFTLGDRGSGTTVIMRYTLRLLTLQQFQRATLLICALEVIRKEKYYIPKGNDLGKEKITIGLFVGGSSLPNSWNKDENSMHAELEKISQAKEANSNKEVETKLPFTNCPWCGADLFVDVNLNNIIPNHKNLEYGIRDELLICCNNKHCSFYSKHPNEHQSLPLRLFDDDIYNYPPTLLFGTIDKFAAVANKVSTATHNRNRDSRRLFGTGYRLNVNPPDLIIQDELHLLLGPLGTAVGLFEKGIDYLCSFDNNGQKIKPKIITSTATTRNTDKQIFALFNRRAEIFPKQGITCDDSFFAYYERNGNGEYISNRKYMGILPIGKTQVWMQLRIASIALAHRIKYLKEIFSIDELFELPNRMDYLINVFDHYHTVLSYFNSLKDVGKTQSQLSHYLPGDLNYVIKNTIPWSFLDKLTRKEGEIRYSELTGRLTGEEVKTNLSKIETQWNLFQSENEKTKLSNNNFPEFIISTNMISVGIDVSRFNIMIISSMPRNIAEYIQASSRVARQTKGIVFTVHHPFRSRDISHYQKFKEFHEKFYSYVEPISITPFAYKALDRYLAMLTAVLIRHNNTLNLINNEDASTDVKNKCAGIKSLVLTEVRDMLQNATNLDCYLKNRNNIGIKSSVEGIISDSELLDVEKKIDELLDNWMQRLTESTCENPPLDFKFRNDDDLNASLFTSISDDNHPYHWKVSHSLREIAPSTVIKTVQQ